MPQFRFVSQKNTSLRHKITDDIRQAIMQGKIKPGDRLKEVEIADQMGVSRGPIREALRSLEQEGLLVSQPYKETTVAEISGEEMLEVLLPIRLTIEQFAVRKGVPVRSPEHLAMLTAPIDEMQRAASAGDLLRVVECDLAFHETLVGLAGMDNLIHIWTSIYNRIRLHFLVQGRSYENLSALWESHNRLLSLIREGDVEQVLQEIQAHIFDTNIPYSTSTDRQ